MKIGFFGNANNYPFMLARALRRLGHEIVFTVWNRELLDRPEGRYRDIPTRYPDWIRDFAPFGLVSVVTPHPKRARLVRLLRSCDAVILNQHGLALAPAIGRPTIALITGTDLVNFAGWHSLEEIRRASYRNLPWLRRIAKTWVYRRLIPLQRAGIQSAATVTCFPKGLSPESDRMLDELGIEENRRQFILMTDLEQLEWTPPPRNERLRIFCATRLNWVRPMRPGCIEMDYKATDVMIRGLGLFLRKGGAPLDMRIVKKGFHVAETIALAESEGIARHVTWCEPMSQYDVWEELRRADVVVEQLGKAFVAMNGLDAMAIGRPVIASGRPEIMHRAIGEPFPVCQAETPEEFCAQLERLQSSPELRESMGRAGRAFVERQFSSDRAARICVERLTQRAGQESLVTAGVSV